MICAPNNYQTNNYFLFDIDTKESLPCISANITKANRSSYGNIIDYEITILIDGNCDAQWAFNWLNKIFNTDGSYIKKSEYVKNIAVFDFISIKSAEEGLLLYNSYIRSYSISESNIIELLLTCDYLEENNDLTDLMKIIRRDSLLNKILE
ncbi:MAG: hypothetical protein H0X63_00130 [Flavobacteriales bacterium]|nr:hypothetical protein [Flavobacteriales bacterium]